MGAIYLPIRAKLNTHFAASLFTHLAVDLTASKNRIERVFRKLKSYLEIQPIYHYAERRIEAHIFLCFLALLHEFFPLIFTRFCDNKVSVWR